MSGSTAVLFYCKSFSISLNLVYCSTTQLQDYSVLYSVLSNHLLLRAHFQNRKSSYAAKTHFAIVVEKFTHTHVRNGVWVFTQSPELAWHHSPSQRCTRTRTHITYEIIVRFSQTEFERLVESDGTST